MLSNKRSFFLRNKTILITGGSGFIGANLARKLVKKNRVHLILRKQANLWRIEDITRDLGVHRNNLENLEGLKKIIKEVKPEVIFHLASYGNYSFQVDPLAIIRTNLLGTANLLAAVRTHDFECLVNTGTSSEYGFKHKPMKESDSLHPESIYAGCKVASYYLAAVFARLFERPIFTLRPFSAYGPYEEPRRLVPTVITKLIDNKPIKLTSVVARRDFIYVDDVVDCYIALVANASSLKKGDVFNAGTGIQHTNEEVVTSAARILNKRPVVKKGLYKNHLWDTQFWVADTNKAKKLLRFKSKYGLNEGLKKTIDWFKSYQKFAEIYGQKVI